MAQVPYSPVPTAQPEVRGEQVSVNTPGAACGTNIAQAVEGLGGTMDKVGGELFTRAIALQELQNETEARNKAADYAEQQGNAQAGFDALEGKAKVDALAPHIQASKDMRTDIRSQVSNPAAQRLYDNYTFNFLQRNIFSSAAGAGQANKQYILNGYNATYQMAADGVEAHPHDDGFYASQVNNARTAAVNAAMVKNGVDENDPIAKNAGDQAVRKILAQRIRGVSHTDPFAAEKMLEDNKAALGSEYDQLEGEVQTKGTAVTSSNIADGVFAAHRKPDGTYDAPLTQMLQEAKDKAWEQFPNNATLPQHVGSEVRSRYSQDDWAARMDRQDVNKGVDQALAQNPSITDVQGLLAQPGMDKIVGRMSDFDKSTLQQRIDNARKKEYSDEWAVNKTKALGLSNSNVVQFLNTDYGLVNLSPQDRATIQSKQTQLAQKPVQDPRVSGAMSVLRTAFPTALDAMGIRETADDKANPDSPLVHFTGALQESMAEWSADHGGKPPDYEAITGPIFKQLTAKQTSHGYLWDSQDYSFKQFQKPLPTEVPQSYVDQVTSDVVKGGGNIPTQDQVYRAYLRDQFKTLFGGSVARDK